MRAFRCAEHGEPADVLKLAEVPVPEPGEGMLRVAVDATGLGFPDVLMCRGSYAFDPPKPFTPGQEIVGRVTQSCAGGPEVGQRVMGVTAFFLGHGGYADEAITLATSTYEAPDFLSDTEAAGFCIPFHTAWIGLVDRADVQPGDTVLVTGAAGSSGTAAIIVAKGLGARVIAVARGAEKARACAALGADLVIDPEARELAPAVEEATGGRGADVIFEVVGGETFMQCTRCIGNRGRILAVGYSSGAWANASTARLVQTNATVMGVYAGAYDRAQMEAMHGALLDQKRTGKLPSPPIEEFPFDALPGALQRLADRTMVGKGVLRVRA